MWNSARRAHVGTYIFVEETERLSMVQLHYTIKEFSIIKEPSITQNMFKGDVYTKDDGSCSHHSPCLHHGSCSPSTMGLISENS